MGSGVLSFARRASHAFALQAGGAALAFILQIALARWMGAEEYGAYALAIALATVLSVGSGLGFPTAVLRFIPTYMQRADWEHVRGILRASTAITLGTGAGIALVGSVFVFGLVALGPSAGYGFALGGLALVPLVGLLTLRMETIRAFHHIGLALFSSTLGRPLIVLIGGAATMAATGHLSANGTLAITGAAIVCLLVVQTVAFRRYLPVGARTVAPRYEVRTWLKVATPMLLITGFVLVLTEADTIFVGAIAGTEDAGLYTAASKTASVVGLILIAVNTVSAPRIAPLFAEDDRDGLERLAATSASLAFWPSLFAGLVLGILGDSILAIFGSEFSSALPVLVILLIGQVVNAASGSVGYLLMLTGNQLPAARVYGFVTIAHLLAMPVAVVLAGTIGAAVITAASFLSWNVWLCFLARRRLGVRASAFRRPLPPRTS